MNSEVVINMRNPNALIAMACVENNSNNPYAVFGEYIKYCIFTNANDEISLDNLKSKISKEFGIDIPNEIINYCINKIITEELIEIGRNGQIIRIGTYDTDTFDKERESYKQTERFVIQELMAFANNHNRCWDYEYARELLIKVLDRDHLAYDIFTRDERENCEVNDEENTDEIVEENEGPLFEDEFIVGKFVEESIKNESSIKDYLVKICEGIMICVGAYQLPNDGESVRKPYVKNTIFIFDTKLLLRLLGIGPKAAVDAAEELYSLIKSLGGEIKYFPHILQEMDDALQKAINALRNKVLVHDSDMNFYIRKLNNPISVLEARKASLAEELKKKGIVAQALGVYTEQERIKIGFNELDLKAYMKEKLIERNIIGVGNDAASILEVHMMRNGNYESYYGTNKRLPVLVTTTGKLVDIALKYSQDRNEMTGVKNWRFNKLPIITAMKLMCRLWSPADGNKGYPLIYLAANAYAAQRPSPSYLNRVKKIALELEKEAPEYANIPLTEFFDDRVIDSIFEKSEVNKQTIDISAFTSTLDEIATAKEIEQKEITAKVEKERDELRIKNATQKEAIIYDAAKRNLDVMDKKDKLKLKAILIWEIFVIIAFTIITNIIPDINSAISRRGKVVLILVISVVSIVQRKLTSNSVTIWLLKKYYPNIKASFERKIIMNLGTADKEYYRDIIEKVFADNELIQQCEKLIEEK